MLLFLWLKENHNSFDYIYTWYLAHSYRWYAYHCVKAQWYAYKSDTEIPNRSLYWHLFGDKKQGLLFAKKNDFWYFFPWLSRLYEQLWQKNPEIYVMKNFVEKISHKYRRI